MSKIQRLYDALNAEFGWDKRSLSLPADGNPWREDPLPLAEFIEHPDHLSSEGKLSLFPEQRKDLEAFLGTDPKMLFDGDYKPEFNQAFIVWGKGCLGKDERLTDIATGRSLTVAQWAELACPLLIRTIDLFTNQPAYLWSSPVYLKGRSRLYRITLSDGRSFVANANHQCFSQGGWLTVKDFWPFVTRLKTRQGVRAIASIEDVGEGGYYDLTVPHTHNYFDSQGILHHNSGKDHCTSLVHCWAIHILLCLHNPQQYLELIPAASIDLPVIGYSENQAKAVYFTYFKARVRSWPWLKRTITTLTGIEGDRWLREGGDHIHAYHLELPHYINCWSLNSSLGSSEGKNVLFWVLDELAAFTSPVKVNLAKEIHSLVTTSARSRFKNRWRGMAISFPRHKGDYVMSTAAKVAKGDITDIYVSVKPTWVVRPDRTREDFASDYALDPEGADTKYGCNPPSSVDSYFRSPELLLLHAHGAPIELLRQHLDLPEETLQAIASLSQNPITDIDPSGDVRLDRRGFPRLARWLRGQKTAAGTIYDYYIHLDPGLSGDAFGLALGHVHQLPSGGVTPVIDLAFRWTGAMFKDFGQIYRQSWFDDTRSCTEEVNAAEVDFRTVREFVFYLARSRNFNIRQVSMDNWNSADSKQELERRGFQTAYRVVSKTDYDEFKNLAYNRQLRYYAQPVFIEECFKLQIVSGTKIDAPRTSEGESGRLDSHKDVADAVAAVSRYLSFFRDSGVEFDKAPEIDLEKDYAPLVIGQKINREQVDAPGFDGFNDVQRSLLERFLSD